MLHRQPRSTWCVALRLSRASFAFAPPIPSPPSPQCRVGPAKCNVARQVRPAADIVADSWNFAFLMQDSFARLFFGCLFWEASLVALRQPESDTA